METKFRGMRWNFVAKFRGRWTKFRVIRTKFRFVEAKFRLVQTIFRFAKTKFRFVEAKLCSNDTKFRPTATKFRNEISPHAAKFVSINHLVREILPTLEQQKHRNFAAFSSEAKVRNLIAEIRVISLISANFVCISFAQYCRLVFITNPVITNPVLFLPPRLVISRLDNTQCHAVYAITTRKKILRTKRKLSWKRK